MRDLDLSELRFVAGANSSPSRPSGCGCSPSAPRSKNNNGYGNGAESGPAPGNSYPSNPTLRPGPDAGGQNTGTGSHRYGTNR